MREIEESGYEHPPWPIVSQLIASKDPDKLSLNNEESTVLLHLITDRLNNFKTKLHQLHWNPNFWLNVFQSNLKFPTVNRWRIFITKEIHGYQLLSTSSQ